MKNLKRPLPEGYDKVDYSDYFELRYLRWDYFVKSKNPESEELASKEAIVRYCARKAFTKYRNEFGFMSMDIEDVENIARVYTVSFLDLYSAKNNKTVKSRHKNKLRSINKKAPTPKELDIKDNKALMSFLSQRLMECAYVFRQKSKGSAGFVYYSVYVQVKGNEWPDDDSLIASPGKYGWEKLSWSKFTKIRSMFSQPLPGYAVEIEGKIYRIASPDTSLVYSTENSSEVFDVPERSAMSPEDILIEIEETKAIPVKMGDVTGSISLKERITELAHLFQERSLSDQERILRRLLKWLGRRNGFQREMENEIRQAHYLLSRIRKKQKDLVLNGREANSRNDSQVDRL